KRHHEIWWPDPVSTREEQSVRPTETVENYSGALHEVSNALTVVLGWLDVASKAATLDEAQEALRVALEHARRGQAMAREGIGAEVTTSVRSRTASELVTFAAQSVGPKAAAASVRVQTEMGKGTDVRVESDASIL